MTLRATRPAKLRSGMVIVAGLAGERLTPTPNANPYVTRSVRRASGLVQTGFWEITSVESAHVNSSGMRYSYSESSTSRKNVVGCASLSQERIEFFYRKSSLPDNRPQRAFIQCWMVGHNDAVWRIRTLKNNVAAALAVRRKSYFAQGGHARLARD